MLCYVKGKAVRGNAALSRKFKGYDY